jgi:exopolysaccharide biosynthesis protein
MKRATSARVTAVAVAVAAAVPLTVSAPAQAAGPAPAAVSTATAVAVPGYHWTTEQIAPGLQVLDGVLHRDTAHPAWTVTVQAPATDRLTGKPSWAEVGDADWAHRAAARAREAGFTPRVERVAWPDYADTPHGTMGLRVRVGSFATQAEATTAAGPLADAGLHPRVEWSGYDAGRPADGEHVHVAVIDPRHFRGRVVGTHHGEVTHRETTSSVARDLGSLVGVNGGFFVMTDADGVTGTQSGLGVYDGRLESMSAGARAALVLSDNGRHVRVADVHSSAVARSGHSAHAVQGVNRKPGVLRDCGRPGSMPTEQPRQDVTCSEADDLVAFTPAFDDPLPAGDGTQAVLDAHGRVVSVGQRGGRVPAGDTVLQGIGDAAHWLSGHAAQGRKITLRETLRDAHGRRIALGDGDSVVSAAPTLVQDGHVHIDAATEGVVDPKDLSFGYAWANVRQPRTMAGVDARGRILLATVDGRLPGTSEGFTIEEAARFMRALGAVQALNLDGGGSTTMTVHGRLVNDPSDATGERAVGDTVQVLPAGG